MPSPATDVHGGSHHLLRTEAGPDMLDPVHDLLALLWADEPEVPWAQRLRFETAVAEVAANIAEHGAASGARQVTLELTRAADGLQAVFEDDGGPAELPEDGGLPPDDAERGRGLVMARAALDSLEHRRDGGTNRWVLRLRV